MTQPDDWDRRVDRVWATASRRREDEVFREVARLAAERGTDDPAALYELASVHDFVGREAEAVPLYRQALASGLDGQRQLRAVLQLGSSLRNLGLAQEAVEALGAEGLPDAGFEREGLAGARSAFLALALADAGRARSAVAVAVAALADHCGEYASVVRRYADGLGATRGSDGESRHPSGRDDPSRPDPGATTAD